jgi:hypothetical protein
MTAYLDPWREELIVKMLADYKAELERLTPDEFRAHVLNITRMHNLTDDEWQALMAKYLRMGP